MLVTRVMSIISTPFFSYDEYAGYAFAAFITSLVFISSIGLYLAIIISQELDVRAERKDKERKE